MSDISIGSKLWMFDHNRRRYNEKRECIFREHFFEVEIIGETSRSWLIGSYRPLKIPKASPWGAGKLYTAKMVEDSIYENEHKYKISELIRYKATVAQLRQIAEILGYQP